MSGVGQGEHPSNAFARQIFGMPPADAYRGWSITWDYGFYTGTGPDYDASWEGEEDGWVDNGHRVSARTREGLIEEIDAWFEEHGAPALPNIGPMGKDEQS